MKHLLSIVAMIMLVAPAFGQLQVKQASKGYETIKSFNMHNVELKLDKDAGVYILALNSDNRFDGYMYIKLGATNEECMQTLNDLLGLYELGKGEFVVVDAYMETGTKQTLGPSTLMGITYLQVSQERMAGKHMLYKPYINKIVNYFGGGATEEETPEE